MTKFNNEPFIHELPYLQGDYEVMYFEDNQNPKVSLHQHPYYEIFLLVQGDIVYNAGDHYFTLKKGDIICNDIGMRHVPIQRSFTESFQRIVLALRPEFVANLSSADLDLARCFDQKIPKTYRFPAEIRCSIKTSINKLIEVNATKPIGADILSRAYIAEILTRINTAVSDKQYVLTRTSVSNEEIISIICSYISEHIATELSIDDLAEIACMSKYHFMRTFKSFTGKSIYQHILLQKAVSALNMALRGTTLSEAAAYYGFNDYSSFYRTCINRFSVSPNDLLVLLQNDDMALGEPLNDGAHDILSEPW